MAAKTRPMLTNKEGGERLSERMSSNTTVGCPTALLLLIAAVIAGIGLGALASLILQ
jgi:hypothetical protein